MGKRFEMDINGLFLHVKAFRENMLRIYFGITVKNVIINDY